MYTRIRVYTCVRSQFERDRGLNNKTRIHTGNDRWCRGGRRPCGAHKASPRLILLSPAPLSSPRHSIAAAFPRAENARPVPGIQSERQHPPSFLLTLPQPPFHLYPAVISSTRSPGLCQARLARGRVPPPVRTIVCPSSPRPVWRGAAAGALHHGGPAWQRGRAATKKFSRGVSGISR